MIKKLILATVIVVPVCVTFIAHGVSTVFACPPGGIAVAPAGGDVNYLTQGVNDCVGSYVQNFVQPEVRYIQQPQYIYSNPQPVVQTIRAYYTAPAPIVQFQTQFQTQYYSQNLALVGHHHHRANAAIVAPYNTAVVAPVRQRAPLFGNRAAIRTKTVTRGNSAAIIQGY